MRTAAISLCGFKFWKSISEAETKKQIFDHDEHIKNENEILRILNSKLIEPFFDTRNSEGKILWECHFYSNYESDSSAIILKFHHSFTDGVGILSLISNLLDNEYEIKLRKNFEPIAWYKWVPYMIIAIPLALCLEHYPLLKSLFTHFDTRGKLISDPRSALVNQLMREGSYLNTLYCSEELPFDKIMK